MEHYERGQRWEDALRRWRILGRAEDEARCLDYLERHLEAARVLEGAGLWEQAAQVYDQTLGQPARAAALYLKAGGLDDAARCFERAEDWREAGDVYGQLDKWLEQARCLPQPSPFNLRRILPGIAGAGLSECREAGSAPQPCFAPPASPERHAHSQKD